MLDLTDKELIESIRSGNKDRVFQQLYREVLPVVKNFICSNSGSEEEAYDIFQDAIVLFYKKVVSGNFNDKYKIKGFIYTVCRNLWINRVKRINRHQNIEDTSDFEDVSDNVLHEILTKEKREVIKKIFENLDAKCMELLKYSVFYGMKMEDIKERMGLASVNAAKTQNYRCKKQLFEKAKKHKYFKDLS